MKKIIFLLCYSINCSCQNIKEIDKLNHLTDSLIRNGIYSTAIEYSHTALKLSTSISYSVGIANSNNNLGIIRYMQGNYVDALDDLYVALKYNTTDLTELGISHYYISSVYEIQHKYSQSISHINTSLKYFTDTKNTKNIINCYNTLCSIYYTMDDYIMSLKYLKQVIKMQEISHDTVDLATSYGNLGIFYRMNRNYDTALIFMKKGLHINKIINNINLVATSYYNIGLIYLDRNKYKEAKYYVNQSLKISKQHGIKDQISTNYKTLAQIDSLHGNYIASYRHYMNYIVYKDSLINEEEIKKTTELELNYNFGIKEAEYDKNTAILNAHEKQQHMIILIGSFGFLIVLCLGIFAYKSYLQKRKAFVIIEHQREEVLSSIRYAKRIQDALLPSYKYIENQLNRLNKY